MESHLSSHHGTLPIRNEQEHTPAEHVLHPHDHDVLCGRGGLTNHHPGNSWYRRLVRSNRSLYKKSPKHTKLLVSKAIVHHVLSQNPPGRFLECHKTNGLWYPVPYKRAVDKTSQALRERDRDDDNDDEVPVLKGNTGLPPNLSDLAQAAIAKSQLAQPQIDLPPPPSRDLTKDSASEHVPPPPGGGKRPLERGSSWFSFGAKRQKIEEDPMPMPTAPLQQRASSVFRFFQKSALFGGSQHQPPALAPAMRNFQTQQNGGYQNFASQSSGANAFSDQSSNKSHIVAPSFGQPMAPSRPLHFDPITSTSSLLNAPIFDHSLSQISVASYGQMATPPKFDQMTGSGLQKMPDQSFRQAMADSAAQDVRNFGLTQSMEQLPPTFHDKGVTPQGMPTTTFNDNQNSTFNQGNMYQQQQATSLNLFSSQYQSNLSAGFQQQSFNHRADTISSNPHSMDKMPNFNLPQDYEPRPLDTSGDFKPNSDVPSLTRFTTQVSDWLASFWPLNRESSSDMAQHQMQQDVMQQIHLPPNSMQIQQIQHHNQNAMQRVAQQQNQLGSNLQQQQQQQQQGHHLLSDNGTDGPPQPPVLAPTVSSTFLKLASSPSRLLSGLSMFFDRGQSSQQVQSTMTSGIPTSMGISGKTSIQNLGGSSNFLQNQVEASNVFGNESMGMGLNSGMGQGTCLHPGTTLGMGPPALGRPSVGVKASSGRSLLDDYEESAMETRLRNVPSK